MKVIFSLVFSLSVVSGTDIAVSEENQEIKPYFCGSKMPP
jgi:hypothetical protein